MDVKELCRTGQRNERGINEHVKSTISLGKGRVFPTGQDTQLIVAEFESW